MTIRLLSICLVAAALYHPARSQDQPSCFGVGSATLPKDLSPPDVPLEDWWCQPSMEYGFMGFSYPLEDSDCSAYVNSFESMNADFARMKQDFGASIVRMYYPMCLESSVFENALKAGVANDMAIIFQVWTDFGNSNQWKQSQKAIYDVLESSEYGPIAPYVVHSADFGSEPVYDGMDGGGDQFIADLALFRKKLNSHGIRAGISEIWDLPGTISSEDGSGLAEIGAGVKANSDYCHAHIMPYYDTSVSVSQAWPYILKQIKWLDQTVRLPTKITETQWAWARNEGHAVNRPDLSVAQYAQYWDKFDAECDTFKKYKVGWFLHTWRGEGTFDIMYKNGTYVIPARHFRKC